MNEEDDKPTVVLDISALKEELANSKKVEAIDQDIEFAINSDDDSASGSELSLDMELEDEVDLLGEVSYNLVFFDYSSEYFTKLVPKLPQDKFDYNVIKSLPELNKILQSGEDAIIFFHYNAAPKAVNQLTTQIKSKFPKAKTVIVAKGLSDAKAKQHQQSKAGANAYLSLPFSVKQFTETVESV